MHILPGFFESDILKFFYKKKKNFFTSFPSKLVNIYGIARIFQNFDDYSGFQKFSGVPILLQHSVISIFTEDGGDRIKSRLRSKIFSTLPVFHCHDEHPSQELKCVSYFAFPEHIWPPQPRC